MIGIRTPLNPHAIRQTLVQYGFKVSDIELSDDVQESPHVIHLSRKLDIIVEEDHMFVIDKSNAPILKAKGICVSTNELLEELKQECG